MGELLKKIGDIFKDIGETIADITLPVIDNITPLNLRNRQEQPDVKYGPCDDYNKMRLLFVNGQETSHEDAKQYTKELSDKLDACVTLKYNPAIFVEGMSAVYDNRDILPITTEILTFIANWIKPILVSKRKFHDRLTNSIATYINGEISEGRRAHVIAFSLGNIYTCRAIDHLVDRGIRHKVSWMAVGSPIDQTRKFNHNDLNYLSSIRRYGDSVCLLSGTLHDFVKGIGNLNAHKWNEYKGSVIDEINRNFPIFLPSSQLSYFYLIHGDALKLYKYEGNGKSKNWTNNGTIVSHNGLDKVSHLTFDNDGNVYAIIGDELYLYRNTNFNFPKSFDLYKKRIGSNGWSNVLNFTAGPNGNLFVVFKTGDLKLYKYNLKENHWSPAPDKPIGNGWADFKSITCTKDPTDKSFSLYCIKDDDLYLYSYNGIVNGKTNWNIKMIGTPGWKKLSSIIAGKYGEIYAVDKNNILYYKYEPIAFHTVDKWNINSGNTIGTAHNFKNNAS